MVFLTPRTTLIGMARQYPNPLKYLVFQSQARKSTVEFFGSRITLGSGQALDGSLVRLDVIDRQALEAFYLWEGEVRFPWEDVPAWKVSDVKGFDLAIWYEQHLCGLCYATPRDSKITIKMVLLEGSPDKCHPLRGFIAALALSAIDAYARMIGCKYIEIQDPESGVVPLYEQLGFVFDNRRRLVISVEPA
ncbi:N-acetyltransferase [Pseudomonas sp. SDO528_S397]